jgi:hypothetical protein
VPGPRCVEGGYDLGPWGICKTYQPLKGLDDTGAVPFLIGVMLKGPDWDDPDENGGILPHLARCSAAQNLGALRDSRALEPLLAMLQHGDFLENKYHITYREKDKFDIRYSAAFSLRVLGDRRAVEPLIAILEDANAAVPLRQCAVEALGQLCDYDAFDLFLENLKNKDNPHSLRETCLRSLVGIRDMRALPDILQVAEEIGYERAMDEPLSYMTGIRFKTRNLYKEGMVEAEDFPELGKVPSFFLIWKHWFKVGESWTRNQFDEPYRLWKDTKQAKPNELEYIRAIRDSMAKPGVGALPLLVDKISQGDVELIPLVSELTGRRVRETATAQEVLDWWAVNKEHWIVFRPGGK